MKTMSILLATAALLAVAGCSKSDDNGKPGKSASISINADDDGDGTVKIAGDSDTGKMELKLPGGFEAKVNMPGALSDSSKFDIDGVGLYPGAKVTQIKVDATDKDGAHDATVVMGFAAPSDAAAVADWYQTQFADKKVAVTRSGETLAGKTEDGNDFTLALVPGTAGKAVGTLTIRDAKKS